MGVVSPVDVISFLMARVCVLARVCVRASPCGL